MAQTTPNQGSATTISNRESRGRTFFIYRGSNGRYYCRRSDDTSRLIDRGVEGGLLGNVIASGGSKILGAMLGAPVPGQSIDRGRVVCR